MRAQGIRLSDGQAAEVKCLVGYLGGVGGKLF